MNKVYCRIISKKLLYEYQSFSKSKKRFFKKKYLYPLVRKIGNEKFWINYNEIKKSSNKYLIKCNSILKNRRKLIFIEREYF